MFILRRPDSITDPQFWAEDGSIFFRQQLVNGWLAAIATPYRGYLPLLPRLFAAPAAIFPIAFAPLVYNLFAILIDSFCCALFFLPRFRVIIESDFLRLALCLLAVGAFNTTELVGTLTNSMWYLTVAGILLMVLPPRVDICSRSRGGAAWLFLGLLIGACAPMVVVGLPIAIYHLARNFRRGGLVSFSIGSGALTQIVFASLLSRGVVLVHPGIRGVAIAMVVAFAYKVMLQALLGATWAFKMATAKKVLYVELALIAAVVWIIYLTIISRDNIWKVWIPVYFIFASMAIPFIGRDAAQGFLNLRTVEPRGERYFLLGSCMFAYLVAYTLCRLASNRGPVLKTVALLAIFAGGLFGNFHAARFYDFHWEANAKRIEEWVQLRHAGKRASPVSVPINPPGWRIDLPGL
ncbi:MAG TPA: hypothetical protein VJP04_02575 [Terriglobales bacterium]|nr:hypothetical protein [Terriglobales bacterium]